MAMTARPLPEQWREPIDRWQAQLQQDGFSEQTIRDRIRSVRRAAQAFAGCPWDLTADRLSTYAEQQSWSRTTRGTWLRTIRLFFEFAVSKGWTERVPTPARHDSLVRQPAVTIWQVELAAWSTWLQASGQSPNTIKLRAYWLRRLACSVPDLGPWDLQLEELAGWLGSLPCGPSPRRVARQSVRAFYRWAATTGRVAEDPSRELPAIRAPHAAPRPAPEHAIVAAMGSATERERLMVELGAVVGLRRAEIAAVHTQDLVLYPDGWVLRVLGKGGETRDMPLPSELGDRLAALPPGWVFPSRDPSRHLSAHYVGHLMSRVLGSGWTAHTLRHRFATRAYSAERDIMAVRELMGHANVRTTQIYTKVPDGARRTAVAAAAVMGG
jgi:site-specific recombinase XerD